MSKVLVVVDMQKDFVDGALRNEEAIEIVPYVKEKIRRAKEAGTKVIFTLDTHDEGYMETEEGKNLPVPHCIRGSEGWKILDELEPEKYGDEFFEKETFGSTALARYFTDNKAEIDEVEFIGVCTDICVISNVLLTKAVLPNKVITVDAAGCAGVTPKAHQTALDAMKACHIRVVNED
jgi:nicotinamidase-related amidase